MEAITSGTQYTVKSDTEAGVTRTGFTFASWNTAANGSGTTYQAGNDLTVTGVCHFCMHGGRLRFRPSA